MNTSLCLNENSNDQHSEYNPVVPEQLAKFYNFVEQNGRQLIYQCKICFKLQRASVTAKSNFIRHLRTQHPEEYGRTAILSPSTSNLNSGDQYQKMQNHTNLSHLHAANVNENIYFQMYYAEDLEPVCNFHQQQSSPDFNLNVECSTSPSRNHLITSALLKMLTVDLLPLNFTQNKGFKDFMKIVDTKYEIPTHNFFTKRIEDIANRALVNLTKELADIPPGAVHAVMELWPTHSQISVVGIRLQYIDDYWNMKSKVLAYKELMGPYTSENITQAIEDILLKYEIPVNTIGYTIIGNAKDNIKTFEVNYALPQNTEENIEDSDFDVFDGNCDDLADCNVYSHLHCVAHKLQLSVKTALEKCDIATNLLRHVYQIALFFKQNSAWNEKLVTATKKEVILAMKTEWNSQLDMLSRIAEEEMFVTVNQLICEARKLGYSAPLPICNKQTLLELIEFLHPLVEAMDQLQGSGVTSSLVIPVFIGILTVMESLKPSCLGSFKDEIINALKNLLKTLAEEKVYLVSTVLDPRIKLSVFPDQFNESRNLPSKATLKEILEQMCGIKTWELQQANEELNSNNQHSIYGISGKRIFNFLEKPPQIKKKRILSEIDIYLEEERSSLCPLTYWKTKSLEIPQLYNLARKYLAVPCSLGCTQRLFMLHRDIAKTRRSQIQIKTLESYILFREFDDDKE